MSDYLRHISFAHLWFALMLPLLWFLWYVIKRKGLQSAMLVSNHSNVSLQKESWLLKLPNALLVTGYICAVVALCRPQIKNTIVQNSGKGVDVMLCMDISGSMLAKDYVPNRIEVAKNVAQQFVEARPYDNIGLVIFSGESFGLAPLTTDHTQLLQQLKNIQTGMLAYGTAIGMGLASAVDRMRHSKAKSKVIILLTDGEDNCIDCPIGPRTAISIAQAMGVKVYTIGVGKRGIAMQPVDKTLDGQWVFAPKEVKIDEDLLRDMANATGGAYYRCENGKELQSVFQKIDKLEKSDISIKKQVIAHELYEVPLLLALLCFILYFIITRTILKSFPA